MLWKKKATTQTRSEPKDCSVSPRSKSFAINRACRGKTLKLSVGSWTASPPIWLSSRRKNKQQKRGGQHWFAVPLGILSYYICVRPHPEIGNAGLHTPMGGSNTGRYFFESAFSKSGGQLSVQMWFWFRITVLPTVNERRIIHPEARPEPQLHLPYWPPTAANSLLWEFACLGSAGVAGSVRPPSNRFLQAVLRAWLPWHCREDRKSVV